MSDDTTLTVDRIKEAIADAQSRRPYAGHIRCTAATYAEMKTLAVELAQAQPWEPGAGMTIGYVPIVVDPDGVRTWLGRARFFSEVAERTSVPGVATGLAVTGAGGDVLFVEATGMSGESGLTITGQLGDVMKESAQIALSYVRSHAEGLNLAADAFDRGLPGARAVERREPGVPLPDQRDRAGAPVGHDRAP